MSQTKKRDRKKRKPKARSSPPLVIDPAQLVTPHALGVPLGVGVRWHRVVRPVVRLGENEIGYCMDPARTDDCLRPAIATVLQVSVEQIPDPRLDQRLAAGDDPEVIAREGWARIEGWLGKRGLELVFHDTVPDRARWVGVTRGIEGTAEALLTRLGTSLEALLDGEDPHPFNDHCVVMSYGQVFFDPAISLTPPRGMRLQPAHPSDVCYGITFEPKEN